MAYELPCPCRCERCGGELVQDPKTKALCTCSLVPKHGGYYGCSRREHVTREA